MSAGVALAWATEALEKGIISTKETIVPLRFGDDAVCEKHSIASALPPTISTDFSDRGP